MVESDDEARSRPFAATPTQRRVVWVLVFLAWTALVVAAWHFWQGRAPPRFPRVDLRPHGIYDVVDAAAGPVSIRLRDAGVVRLAGVLEPEDAPDRDRALTFLQNLLPAGADVYVESEGRAPNNDGTPPLATVYLPPKQAPRTDPFPYAEAQLVARMMVQEGLVRVRAGQPYRYRSEFLLLEDDARRHTRGLWVRPSP